VAALSSAANAGPPPAVSLPGDLIDRQTLSDLQAAEIDTLQTNLATQVSLNQKQANQIVSLLRYIRNSNSAQKANRVREGLRQRVLKVRALARRFADGALGPEVPGTVLTEEIRLFRDLAERLRCRVDGVDKLLTDDCIDSEGETIEEDDIVVDVVFQSSVTAYSDNVEDWADDAEVVVVNAIGVQQTAECDLWAADPDNQVKEQLCYASLGLPTDDTLTTVLTAMNDAQQEAEEFVYPELQDPYCFDIIDGGVSSCPDTTGSSEAVGAWESITVPGETFQDPGGCTIDSIYDWNC
jgi:hypothetical protein